MKRKSLETMPAGGQNKIRSPEIDAQIITSLENGITFKKTCENLGINPSTVFRWRLSDPSFEARCICAEAHGASMRVDEAYELIEKEVDVNRLRVHLNFIQWEVSKRNPHVFGDRINIDVTNRIDLSNVLTAAEQRIKLANRHGRDIENVKDAEIVDTKQELLMSVPAGIAGDQEKPNDFDTPEISDPLGLLK